MSSIYQSVFKHLLRFSQKYCFTLSAIVQRSFGMEVSLNSCVVPFLTLSVYVLSVVHAFCFTLYTYIYI